jgi:hypothetical protein
MSAGNPSVVTGARTNYGTVAQNIKVRDVEDKITLLKPYLTPIDDFFVSKYMKERETRGEYSKFEWNEDKYLPSTVALSQNITGGSTSATVYVASDYFLNYDTVLIEETGDVVVVSGVTAGSFTGTKVGAGNLTSTTNATGNVMRLVQAFPENAVKQSGLSTLTVPLYGYCQIMKKAIQMSGREQATDSYGDGWAYQSMKSSLEIRESQERNWMLAGAAYKSGTTTTTTYTAGLRGTLTTNYIPYQGSLDELELDQAITQIRLNGNSQNSDTLVALCGAYALMDINGWIKNKYSIHQNSAELMVKQYGVATTEMMGRPKFIDYIHPMGILRVLWQPQLSGAKWGTVVCLFDPSMVIKRFMGSDEDGSRKYRLESNIKTPGQDTKEAQLLFDQGLQIKCEETGGWLIKS